MVIAGVAACMEESWRLGKAFRRWSVGGLGLVLWLGFLDDEGCLRRCDDG